MHVGTGVAAALAGVVEADDESGRSFEVAAEGGDDRLTLLVAADGRIVGGRR